jgi:UPF0271 protein
MFPESIDLNADLGEGCPWDEALLDRVSSASICCGEHAGDEETSLATIRAAIARSVVVGAHPGYPDRENFGRSERTISREEVASLVALQLVRFDTLSDYFCGQYMRHVKPHGALYNQAQRDPEIARGIVEAMHRLPTLRLALLGLPGSEAEAVARASGIRFVAEGFADRGYRDDGSLIPRGEPGALLTDPSEIADQVERLVRSGRVETLCIHGDSPGAVALIDIVRSTLDRLGVAVRPFST